jgi:hypothetical protein
MSTPNLITRQDVANLLGDSISVDMVRKNEKSLGIDRARKDINKRLIRYRRDLVVQILTARGLLSTSRV